MFEQRWSQFVETGDICPLALGASRPQIVALFGPPDDFSTDSTEPDTAAMASYCRSVEAMVGLCSSRSGEQSRGRDRGAA